MPDGTHLIAVRDLPDLGVKVMAHQREAGIVQVAGINENLELTVERRTRIVALADVYDALTSKRVYKEAMSHQQASQIIREASETQFDPQVVEAFLAGEREFSAIAAASRTVSEGTAADVTAAEGTVTEGMTAEPTCGRGMKPHPPAYAR